MDRLSNGAEDGDTSVATRTRRMVSRLAKLFRESSLIDKVKLLTCLLLSFNFVFLLLLIEMF